jgi:ribonuclease HI
MQTRLTDLMVIFADGASSGNPGPGGWGAVLLLPGKRVSEMGGGIPATTNNRMELTAVLEGLRELRGQKMAIRIYTDSAYVLHGIQRWIHGWRARGWVTAGGQPVANQDLWEALSQEITGRNLEWCYVPGHSGIAGNERADQIAVQFSQGLRPFLFQGELEDYGHSILPLPDPHIPLKNPSKKESSKKPYSYLSVLGNTPMRHATWAECEKRVKGQSSARYRKAMSPAEEEEILESWGFSLKDVT